MPGPQTKTNICWSQMILSAVRSLMNAKDFRGLADPCRELSRVAVRDDIRQQLRQGR